MARAIVLMLFAAPVFAADLVNVAGASRLAIDGYDPVAFFTDSKPVKGLPSISTTLRGATYWFASDEHRKLFEQDPDTYLPQYGGYCAYGVAVGGLYPVDISTWQVRNGKLYLNKDHKVLRKFNADVDGNISKANENWPGLVAKNAK
jgi:YHS domain-containing protein